MLQWLIKHDFVFTCENFTDQKFYVPGYHVIPGKSKAPNRGGVALIISIMILGGWNAPGAFWTFCSNVCPRTICALYSNMCSSTQDAVHRNRQLDGCANQFDA